MDGVLFLGVTDESVPAPIVLSLRTQCGRNRYGVPWSVTCSGPTPPVGLPPSFMVEGIT
jgi:hypothetical protein